MLLGMLNCLAYSSNQEVSYLYAHGLADHKEQAFWYLRQKPNGAINKHYIIDGKLFTFDFPDATKRFWRINFPQCSLGQGNEIYAFYKAYAATREKLTAQNSSQNLVLVGLSRGASVVLAFLGLFNAPQVKAAVLESPFDSLYNVVKTKLSTVDRLFPWATDITYSLLSIAFMQHKRHGICPIEVVHNIPKDFPLIIISSKQDSTAPCQGAKALYRKLLETNHPNAHILVLDNGRHSKLLKDEQGHIYQNTVHAFYKKFNLPHNPEFAALGQATLQNCQPTLKELGLQ